MTEPYLPEIYSSFRKRFPELAENLDSLAKTANAGPLDERTSRLVKLGITIGAMSEGAVRSNAATCAAGWRIAGGTSPCRGPHRHYAGLPGRRGVVLVDRGRAQLGPLRP